MQDDTDTCATADAPKPSDPTYRLQIPRVAITEVKEIGVEYSGETSP